MGEERDMSDEFEDLAPWGGYVLVRVPEVGDDFKTETGFKLHKPVNTKDREQITQEIGILESWGPLAFEDSESKVGAGDGPERWGAKIGAKVLFSRQGGKRVDHPGLDPSLRLLNDNDLLAGIGG
jgi:hypothetical protein